MPGLNGIKYRKKYMTRSNEEGWMNSKWRPAMGWTYMAICIFDFILAPIAVMLVQAHTGGSVTTQWKPLTMDQGGFFHMAMGAVLGVAAWTRGQEKITAINKSNPQKEE